MDGESPSHFDEDHETVSRCREGDVDAFEEIVRKYQKKMLNISYRIVGDFDDALEVAQDAFVSAYRNIDRFRGNARFSTWLYAIVVNLSRNRVKHVRTRSQREQLTLDDPVENEGGRRKIEPVSGGLNALEVLEQMERDRKVQKCIDSLGDEFRETLVLRDIQGFSYEEIGDMLKIALGTVRSRLSRAREVLRKCLKKHSGDRGNGMP
jgi:RNA polymerase sigma-70 factor (ECF subfamily)